MKTIGHYVYKLRDLIRQKSDDSGVSNRLLFSIIKGQRNDFIKQELDKKRLLRSMGLQSIDCLPMEPSTLKACCGIDLPISLMKSTKPVPNTIEANSGPSIQGIYPIDGSVKIHYGTRNDMLRKLNRTFLAKSGQAFVEGGYLYIYNYDLDGVKITGNFSDPEEIAVMNECKAKTGNCYNEDALSCLSYLELEFPCPDYLEDDIIISARDKFIVPYLKLPLDTTNDSREIPEG